MAHDPLTDDDDLFAVRPAPPAPPAPAPPPRRTRREPPPFIGPRWPVATLACICGARDEVREPCPDVLNCWGCKRVRTMIRYAPRYLPPLSAGRTLNASPA